VYLQVTCPHGPVSRFIRLQHSSSTRTRYEGACIVMYEEKSCHKEKLKRKEVENKTESSFNRTESKIMAEPLKVGSTQRLRQDVSGIIA
jgi:hypothetical protein